MPLIKPPQGPPVELRLSRDLVRTLKRGHPWVFADALRHLPPARPGSPAILLDNKKGRPVAHGFYHAQSPLAFRVCSPNPDEPLTNTWAEAQLTRALRLRKTVVPAQTSGYRLFNGEGDGLPGLICDIYSDTAVMQLDGPGPAGFWDAAGIARWLAEELALKQVMLKPQSRSNATDQFLVGQLTVNPVPFLENGVYFVADVINGQKTGFFLDQRNNRKLIGEMAANRAVLNVFGYTGGFSVYAGLGGASRVTTVDLSGPALQTAEQHWRSNNLPPAQHRAIKADAFSFLADAAKNKDAWDLVVIDPPSFASSKETLKSGLAAYQKLIAAATAVVNADGLLAAASCSSHVDLAAFLIACEEGVSKARRRATVLAIAGQPADHPTPLVFSEFRYLKFVLMRVE